MKEQEPLMILQDLSKKYLLEDSSEYWALKNISFNLNRGDVLGVIGKNGAGKSTLLKILSSIIPPTGGTLKYKGKIVSILEIGTGFHPDLSGKENVYINASLLGFKRSEIKKIYNEIVEFSGIKHFINEPVKHYSSGMYLRLALSIALFIESDVLLFDEVISVGDAEFTAKALDRVTKLTRSGKACIIISHNLSSVVKLCNRCILLDSGKILLDGSSQYVVEEYLKDTLHRTNDTIQASGLCEVLEVYSSKPQYYNDEGVQVFVRYKKSTDNKIDIVLKVRNYFSPILTTCELYSEHYVEKEEPAGEYLVSCCIPSNLFNSGSFLIDVIVGNKVSTLVYLPSVVKFSVKVREWELDKKWNEEEEIIPFRPICKWQTISQ